MRVSEACWDQADFMNVQLENLWQLPGNLLLLLRTRLSSIASCNRIFSATHSQLSYVCLPSIFETLQNSSSVVIDRGPLSQRLVSKTPQPGCFPPAIFSCPQATVIWGCIWQTEQHNQLQSTVVSNGAIQKDSQRILMKTRKPLAAKSNCGPGLPAPLASANNPQASFFPQEQGKKIYFAFSSIFHSSHFLGHLGQKQGTR